MNGWVLVLLVGGALLALAMLLDATFDSEQRLARLWVAGSQGLGWAAGPVLFLRSTALLALYSAVAWLGHLLSQGLGHPAWALLVSGPAMLVYAPVVLAMAPFNGTAYAAWRSHLAAAGADPRLQRAIAWWAGPPALVGFGTIVLTLATAFDA